MVKPPSFASNGMKKGAWSEEEDEKLRAYVQRYGHWNWRLLPKYAGLARCGKSCRLRWLNYLKPGVKKGNFSKHEEDRIFELHDQLGNKWSAIAAKLPGRTDNEIKNFWNTHIKKRLNPNPPTKKVNNKASASSRAQALDEENPSETITTLNESAASDAPIKSQNSTLPLETNPSGLNADSQVNFWHDTFLPDTAYTQNDYFPSLLEEDQLFYSQFHCSELSNSSSSCLSALDWFAGDDPSIRYFDCEAQLLQENFWSESFVSNTSSSLGENSDISSQKVGGFYDPFLQSYDQGLHI